MPAAKTPRKSSRQGAFSKVANILLWLLAFSNPITQIIRNPNATGVANIIFGATGGANVGRFDINNLIGFYAPVGAAASLGFVKSWAMKKWPVR